MTITTVRSTTRRRKDRGGKFTALVYVREDHTGTIERVYSSQTFATERAADEWGVVEADKLRRGVGVDQDKAKMTFGDFADTYYWAARTGRTDKNPRDTFDAHVRPRWGHVRLADITTAAVLKWLIELTQTPKRRGPGTIGASYVRSIWFTFTPVVRKAVSYDAMAKTMLPDDDQLEKLLAKPAPKRVSVLAPHEIEFLASVIRQRVEQHQPRFKNQIRVKDFGLANYTLVYCLAYSGLRISEAMAIKVRDLDLINGIIEVDEQLLPDGTVSSTLKTRHSYRRVPIAMKVRDLLVEHLSTNLAYADPEALVFTTDTGAPLLPGNWRNRWFNPARTQIGKPDLVPHDLRHTAATAWHDEGFDTYDIARLLGDTREVVERTYVHSGVWTERDARHDRMDERTIRGTREAAEKALGRSPTVEGDI